MPAFACKFTPDGLHGHLLAVADEDGSVRLLDTRKELSEGFISGKSTILYRVWLVWHRRSTEDAAKSLFCVCCRNSLS